MAADIGMDWDALLQQSEELAAGVRVGERRRKKEDVLDGQSNGKRTNECPSHRSKRQKSNPSPGTFFAVSHSYLSLSLSPRASVLTIRLSLFVQKSTTTKMFIKQDSAAAAAFPRVERDLLQVEAYASALRARLARADGRGDAAAAARLLAHEGVNTRK